MPFYAVAKGRKVGVYHHWDEVKPLVNGFSGPRFKKFPTLEQANKFIEENSGEQTPRERHNNTRSRVNPDFVKHREEVRQLIQQAERGILLPTTKVTVYPKVEVHLKEENLSELDENYIPPQPINPNKPIERIPDNLLPPSFIGWTIIASPDVYDIVEDLPEEIYTDGASRGNGSSSAISGYGVYLGRRHTNFSVGWKDCKIYAGTAGPTNQTLELLAIRHALKLIETKKPSEIVIKTDSQFGIDCLTKWCKGWETKGWMKKDGKPVIHREILKECRATMERINSHTYLRFVHVRGHRGNYGNEMADLLANLACDRSE